MSSSEDGGTDGDCENPPCVTHAVVADALGVEVTTSSVSDRVAFLTQNQSDRGVEKPWILDSGASCHMSPFPSDFLSIQPTRKSITVANGVKIFSTGVGTAKTSTRVHGKEHRLNLREALLVPDLTERLVSIHKLDALGLIVKFENSAVTISDKAGKLVAAGVKNGSVYQLSVFRRER